MSKLPTKLGAQAQKWITQKFDRLDTYGFNKCPVCGKNAVGRHKKIDGTFVFKHSKLLPKKPNTKSFSNNFSGGRKATLTTYCEQTREKK